MEYFRRTFDTRSTGADIIAFARMNAFKFPDKMDVFLSCELEMCKGGCDTHCEMDDYPIDIIENLGFIRQPDQSQDTVAVTTFRPQLRPQARTEKTAKQLMRRRKPKKFGSRRVKDDARRLLSPPSTPVTLSPEILELLEELGAQTEAQERSSEASPFTEVVFTSPKSVEKFAKHSQPKEALIKILDSSRPISQLQPPKRADIKPARARFGSRLANNAKRFASFFGARRRRDADPDDWDDYSSDMFGPSETVNMVRGFQVVSAADLAFDPKSMQTLLSDIKDGPEEEICFPETSFYAALLVACSLLMISGIVSVCSIRTVRRLRNKRIKQRYFGGDTSLESY